MRLAVRILGATALWLGLSGAARAETIGFTAYFTGASIALDNDSSVVEITAFSITIGDLAYNFDRTAASFVIGGQGSSFVQLSPDDLDDGVGSNLLSFAFQNFLPGDRFDSPNDIDPDTGNSACCNVSGILFNNGAVPNAAMSVSFSNGFTFEDVMFDTQDAPDPGGSQCLVFGVCKITVGVDTPEPGLPILLGLVAAAVAARGRYPRS